MHRHVTALTTAALLVAAIAPAAAAKPLATASVDFAACTNQVAALGQPVGASLGNTTAKDAKLSFTLLDPGAGNNVWVGQSGGATIDIAVSVPNATAVTMLINSFYGQSGIANGTVTLKGTGKAHASFKLIGNSTIRDYNNWVWTNTIDGTKAQEWWTNNPDPMPDDQSHRLDAHVFKLGASFAGQTLTDIILTAPAGAGVNDMEPALFAVGVAYHGAKGTVASTCTAQ